MARALRTFIALWPEAEVQRALAERAAAVARATDGRAPRADALHLTLVFTGPTPPERVDALRAMMDRIEVPRFELVLDRSGWFRQTGVAWLGASAIPEPLVELQRALAQGATRVGFSLDVRPYVPHLTLARHARRQPPAAMGAAIAWAADAFTLLASELTPDGPRYRTLHRTALTPSGFGSPNEAQRSSTLHPRHR